MEVLNHDVAGFHTRINRFIGEMIHSVSGSGSEVNKFDSDRLTRYLGAVRAYHTWVVSQPQLDLPETYPRAITLRADPTIPDLENESVNDILRMLAITRDELVNSQSARDSAGIKTFDSSRLLAMVTKVEKFLTEYVDTQTPLDLPESSPRAPGTGPGLRGI